MIIVDRHWDQPVAMDDVQAKEDAVAWCLEQYGVTFLHTYFSYDRKRMACVYDAPDADAVRHTQRTGGLEFTAAWPADSYCAYRGRTVQHDVGDKSIILVERRFPRPVTPEHFKLKEESGDWCYEQYGVDVLESYIATDGSCTLCVFAAPDAEALRRAERSGGTSYERIWPATFHAPAGT